VDQMRNIGNCEHCHQSFNYKLIHNGFNDTAYVYCDMCGCTALVSAWSKLPVGLPIRFHERIGQEAEPFLQRCGCGGRFRASAGPRCPHCRQPLSPEIAAGYLEANAPGSAMGWRWQRSWSGLYCIIIDGRSVKAQWITPPTPIDD
jgi:hypothetical protein